MKPTIPRHPTMVYPPHHVTPAYDTQTVEIADAVAAELLMRAANRTPGQYRNLAVTRCLSEYQGPGAYVLQVVGTPAKGTAMFITSDDDVTERSDGDMFLYTHNGMSRKMKLLHDGPAKLALLQACAKAFPPRENKFK